MANHHHFHTADKTNFASLKSTLPVPCKADEPCGIERVRLDRAKNCASGPEKLPSFQFTVGALRCPPICMAKGNSQKPANGSALDFEAQLWAADDKVRGRVGDIAVYMQESNYTTWKLARMNLAIRGIDANLGPRNADSFRADLHTDLKTDFVPVRKDLANPLFNMSDWGGENMRQDALEIRDAARE
jgi:N-6 DNA Methylase